MAEEPESPTDPEKEETPEEKAVIRREIWIAGIVFLTLCLVLVIICICKYKSRSNEKNSDGEQDERKKLISDQNYRASENQNG